MAEKHLDFELKYETPWNPSEELYNANVFGALPSLIDINGSAIFGTSAIREYLEELYPERNLLGSDYSNRAEARKIADWFAFIFFDDIYKPIICEKIIKRFSKNVDRTPAPSSIRIALSKLPVHLDYVTWLIDRRNWLAGRDFSIADIYGASFFSVLDYLGFISWNKYEVAKSWYVRIKSRPGFRGILNDNLPQLPPSEEYSNPDF
jgi:glutathione S-transferase